MKHTLIDTINRTYKTQRDAKEGPFRRHLGGSEIGNKCERALYYSFRWFKRPDFDGRMLRLFDRGHSEEFKNVALLRSVGIEVRAYSQRLMYHSESDSYMLLDWRSATTPPTEAEIEARCDEVTESEYHVTRAETQGVKLTQWRISDVMKHFGGSLDGEGVAPFDLEINDTGRFIPAGTPFLLEFKTHNTKSFLELSAKGVKESKPVHWDQMQIYMHKRGYKFALYMAINKNDDDLHVEIVEYDEAAALALLEKAKRVIHSTRVPDRIGKHPSWYDCKFCHHAPHCHYGDQSGIDRNCRSCVNSVPVDDGQWHCKLWNAIIPVDAVLTGCESHKVITD